MVVQMDNKDPCSPIPKSFGNFLLKALYHWINPHPTFSISIDPTRSGENMAFPHPSKLALVNCELVWITFLEIHNHLTYLLK